MPRLNPESEWVIRDEPDLRIIDQDLWARVKVRQVEARAARDDKFSSTGNPVAGAKRPQHLLTGLVRCGVCGGDYISMGAGRWRCKAAMRQACSNGSITAVQLEDRVLAGLRDRLLTPEVISRFAAHLQRELDNRQREAHSLRNEIEVALEEARLRVAKIIRRIGEDDDAPRSLSTRLKELEAEETRLEQELAWLPHRVIVRLPANYELVYRTAIAQLEQHLTTPDAASSRGA